MRLRQRHTIVVSTLYGLLTAALMLGVGLSLAPQRVARAGPATWSFTASMSATRYHHRATLLFNGQVLVTAGYDGHRSLSSAELYDPANAKWSPTEPMGTARFAGHTATLLPNGQVLVAGGFDWERPDKYRYLSSAELYDPATGTWSPTGAMRTARYDHTATLLPNGKVLFAGESGDGGDLSSAELYDPTTGTWSPTGAMGTARKNHTATLLAFGQVLVAGGWTGGMLSSAELYDAATGTWNTTESMGASRYIHTATRLYSGRVLVAGGFLQESAELYDPAFEPVASIYLPLVMR
jgi:hypothetical protein